MDILNSNNKSKKHFLQKKYKLLIEVTFKDGEFVISQKLNSFFGQIGVFEGGDKLIKYIETYFKSMYLDYLNLQKDITPELELQHEMSSTKNIVFFLPVTIYFYFGDKKCDFFVNAIFNKRYFFDKKTVNLLFNY